MSASSASTINQAGTNREGWFQALHAQRNYGQGLVLAERSPEFQRCSRGPAQCHAQCSARANLPAGGPVFLKLAAQVMDAVRGNGRSLSSQDMPDKWEIKLGGLEKAVAQDTVLWTTIAAAIPGKRGHVFRWNQPTGSLPSPADPKSHSARHLWTPLQERMANSSRLIFAACGTSWHSSLIAKYVPSLRECQRSLLRRAPIRPRLLRSWLE